MREPTGASFVVVVLSSWNAINGARRRPTDRLGTIDLDNHQRISWPFSATPFHKKTRQRPASSFDDVAIIDIGSGISPTRRVNHQQLCRQPHPPDSLTPLIEFFWRINYIGEWTWPRWRNILTTPKVPSSRFFPPNAIPCTMKEVLSNNRWCVHPWASASKGFLLHRYGQYSRRVGKNRWRQRYRSRPVYGDNGLTVRLCWIIQQPYSPCSKAARAAASQRGNPVGGATAKGKEWRQHRIAHPNKRRDRPHRFAEREREELHKERLNREMKSHKEMRDSTAAAARRHRSMLMSGLVCVCVPEANK